MVATDSAEISPRLLESFPSSTKAELTGDDSPSSVKFRPSKWKLTDDESPRRSSKLFKSIPLLVLLREKLDHATAHAAKEKVLIKSHYRVLLLCIVFQYVHSVATNVAYYLHSQREPLFDLGFALFPALSRNMQILSEILFFILLISTICFAASPFYVKRNRPLYTTVIMARFLGVCAVAQALRCISFLVTSLPGPNYHCRPQAPDYSPPKSAYDIFLRQDAFFGCGDLVFSSHTIFVLLCALTYTKYGDAENRWLKRAVWCLVVFFGMLVVSARKHYSLDIVVAWYTVPLLWIAYEKYFPDKIPQEFLDQFKDESDLKKEKDPSGLV